MLLTGKKEILAAMDKELEGASSSSIKWLADIFNVPPRSDSGPSRRKASASSVAAHRYIRRGKKAVSETVSKKTKTKKAKSLQNLRAARKITKADV